MIYLIDECAGLLPPGLVERSAVDRIKTDLIHQSHHELFGPWIVAQVKGQRETAIS